MASGISELFQIESILHFQSTGKKKKKERKKERKKKEVNECLIPM